jgi:glutathione S-transferase
MKFYSAWYCPFAQRSWMALVYKDIDFDLIEVDPYDLTDSWLEISRGAALVPVVVQANGDGSDTTIVESNRILEYLEDYYPEKAPIFSDSPNRRAEQKYWMDHVSNKITPYFYRFLKMPEAGKQQDEARDKMLEGLMAISQAMSREGPYFSGERLSAVDIALFPFAYRIDALLGHYRNYALPREGVNWERYHRWYDAMLGVPAFKATATDHSDYKNRLVAHYLPYSQGEGQTDVTAV